MKADLTNAIRMLFGVDDRVARFGSVSGVYSGC